MTIIVHNLDAHPTKPYREFVDLQRDFKTYGDLRKLADRIQRVGFKYDFFAWETPEPVAYQGETYPAGTCFIVDAHSRQRALRLIEEDGHAIPPVPYTRVHAASLDEAKEEILFLNSKYGEIDEDSTFLQETLAAMEEEDKALLALMQEDENLETPHHDFSELESLSQALEGFQEVDIVISVPLQHEHAVKLFLANGEMQTAPGMGKGVLKRCGLQ